MTGKVNNDEIGNVSEFGYKSFKFPSSPRPSAEEALETLEKASLSLGNCDLRLHGDLCS